MRANTTVRAQRQFRAGRPRRPFPQPAKPHSMPRPRPLPKPGSRG
ncbi:hypothetical protein AB0I84_32710 [Streptomyces spectabilis]